MSSFNLSPKPSSISEHVYLSLRRAILKGDLEPGYRLLVLDLANTFQTSQGPVREALERLKQEELIVSKPNKGSIVSDITLKEIKDVYAVRELIEGYAIRETMSSITAEDIQYLEQVLSDMKQAIQENDSYKLIECDMDLHGFMYEKCNNDLILDMWNNMKTKIMRFIAVTSQNYTPDYIVELHAELIATLKTGDIEETVKMFIQSLQSNKDYFSMVKKKG